MKIRVILTDYLKAFRNTGCSCFLMLICVQTLYSTKKNQLDYVNTGIGVYDNRYNNCVIGPMMPFGSINPSPQTPKDMKFRWGGHDGYDPGMPVSGFGQLHVSGTGWGSYGHFLISPQTGISTAVGTHNSAETNQVAKPYYFKTTLIRYGITTEITPRYYSAMYRFSFPASDSAFIVFDASQSLGLDIATQIGGAIYENSATIDAQQRLIRGKIKVRSGWPEGAYTIYFVAEFNKPFVDWGVWKDDVVYSRKTFVNRDESQNQHIGTYCRFKFEKSDAILMKAAISFVSFDNAEKLLTQEIPHWDFNDIMAQGQSDWNRKLKAIQIECTSVETKSMFYTSMYRVLTMARNRTEDKPYRKSKIPYWDDNYAFWDTWRTAYPMLLLIDRKAMRDNVAALLERFSSNGFVRDGFIAGRDKMEEQGGNNVDNILAEAVLKGLEDVDYADVYQLLKYNADNERNGLPDKFWKSDTLSMKNNKSYKKLGWIPECVMSTSTTIEYAYNDFCVAQVARKLGKNDDYTNYIKRSRGWESLWNDTLYDNGFTGFVDARKADGSFAGIHPGKSAGSWKTPFYEGDAWTYSFAASHDFDKLIELMGGKVKYAERLDFAFRNKLIDIANEPAFLIARSFSDAGRPDLTSYWTHFILNNYYNNMSYPGNEDTGAMASWYMFSVIGIFPKAGTDMYYLNAPKVSKTIMDMGNSKKLSILATNTSDNAVYIQSCRINGRVWTKPFFNHADIANGAVIEMKLSESPTDWCK